MPEEDYYQVLNIERSATQDEIKKAYRALALQYHPDINPDEGAKERIKELNQAYSVLADPQLRQTYDLYGVTSSSQVFACAARQGRPFGGCRRNGRGMGCGVMGIWQELLRKR